MARRKQKGSATVNFMRNFRALSKSVEFHPCASAQGRDSKRMRGCGGEGGRETISRARALRSFLSSDIGILFRRLGLRHRNEAGIPRDPVQQRQQLAHGRDYRPLVRMALRPLLVVVAAEDYSSLPFLCSALLLLGRDATRRLSFPSESVPQDGACRTFLAYAPSIRRRAFTGSSRTATARTAFRA